MSTSSRRLGGLGHAHHFLSRLDRLDRHEHLEQAKALYNDVPLLTATIARANLPSTVDRIAISLDDASQGPWLIVTRDGKFVTCLGRGMRPRQAHAVISSRDLGESVSFVGNLRSHVETLGEYVPRSGGDPIEGLFGWLHKRPELFALEDARALAAVAALNPSALDTVFTNANAIWSALILMPRRGLNKHGEELMKEAQRASHVSAHILVALSEAEVGPLGDNLMNLATIQLALYDPRSALRVLWAIARCARRFSSPTDVSSVRAQRDSEGARLLVVAEVFKLLGAGTDQVAATNQLHRLARALQPTTVSAAFDDLIQSAVVALRTPDESLASVVSRGRAIYEEHTRCLPASLRAQPATNGVVPVTAAMTALCHWWQGEDDEDHSPDFVAAAPFFARSALASMYFPRAVLQAVQRTPALRSAGRRPRHDRE